MHMFENVQLGLHAVSSVTLESSVPEIDPWPWIRTHNAGSVA